MNNALQTTDAVKAFELSVSGKLLSSTLKTVLLAVEKKSTIPILHGVKLDALQDGILRITGTDLEMAISVDIIADVVTPGSAVIADARGFAKTVASMGKVDVTIEGYPTYARLIAGPSNVTLTTMAVDSYPVLPTMPMDDGILAVIPSNLQALISKTSFAIAKEESRFTLNGALMELDGELKMVATDGHRLSLASVPAESTADKFKALVPHASLKAILKAFDKVHGDVLISRDENHVFFANGATTVTTRILAGNFPDYRRVLPKQDGKRTLCVSRKPLLDAVTRADQYVKDLPNRNIVLTLNGCCKVAAKCDGASYVEDVPALWDGVEDWPIGLNALYLSDWLKSQLADSVTLLLTQ